MKLRLDFVTNSSSTSYICDICGIVDSGYCMDPSDLGFFVCHNYHIICIDHMLNDINKEMAVDFLEKLISNNNKKISKLLEKTKKDKYILSLLESELKTLKSILGEIINSNNKDELTSIIKKYEIMNKIFCPICRFKNIATRDIIKYIEKTIKPFSKYEEEIKTKFKDYNEFKEFLKENKQ